MMHIFDQCDLSPYVTSNVFSWNVLKDITDSTSAEYLYLFPEDEVLPVLQKSVCFPAYLDPLLFFYDSRASWWDYFTDLYNAITSINAKFA